MSSFYLPDEPLFTRLVWVASQHDASEDYVFLNDRDQNVHVNYAAFLRDILAFRQKIREILPQNLLESNGMVSQEGVYVCLLESACYEYLVAVFAVASLGAAVGLIANVHTPEEALYILNLCNAPCLLTGPGQEVFAGQIQDYAQTQTQDYPALRILPITRSSGDEIFPSLCDLIQPGVGFPDTRPGVFLFSSGTVRSSKVVIHSRRYLSSLAQLPPRVGTGDVHLCLGNVIAWTSGFHQVTSSLLRGVRVEIFHSGHRVDLLWDRLREGDITTVCFPVETWWALRRHFQDDLARLPADQVEEYVRGVRNMRAPQTTGGMPPSVLKRFWHELIGRPLLVCFGSTETGLSFLASEQESSSPEANIGTPAPGVTVKLSEGDHGELLVKKASLFLGYLGKDSTGIFDEEGFYRTGDNVHRKGDSYIWDGRAEHDIINVDNEPVYLPVIENKILELPYVDEACILPLREHEQAQVAALVRLRKNKDSLSLETLRNDLSTMLPPSHLPTVLRVLSEGDKFQRTWTDKIAVGEVIEKYFK